MIWHQRTLILSAGFAAGFAGMTLELAAVRLLAPYFGTSAYVWTNVIAVTLLSLAVGAWIGGRIADRGHPERALLLALVAGGVLSVVAPLFAPLLASEILPSDLRLDEAFALFVSGSLLATLAVFGPPLALVGACSPLLVRRLVDAGASVGRGSGGVYAWSTLGSLLGTFGTTHWFVPYLGSKNTILLAGLALFAAAACLLFLGSSKRAARAGLAVLLIAGASVAASETLIRLRPPRALAPGWTLLSEERESVYQSVRVIERRDGDSSLRYLQVNDGLDSYQSLQEVGEIFTDTYYDQLAVTILTVPKLERPTRVLILGLGGGTLVPLLHALSRADDVAIELVGVEIDALVVTMAQKFLGLDPNSVEIHADLDARVALRALPGTWDAVLVDAYAGQVHIPAHLCSREFFAEVAERMHPHGVIALNVGAIGPEDQVASAVANTLARVCGTVYRWPVPRNRNEILCAKVEGAIDLEAWAQRIAAAEQNIDEQVAGRRAKQRLQEMQAALWPLANAVPHTFQSAGVLLSDDDTRIDILQMEALQKGARKP